MGKQKNDIPSISLKFPCRVPLITFEYIGITRLSPQLTVYPLFFFLEVLIFISLAYRTTLELVTREGMMVPHPSLLSLQDLLIKSRLDRTDPYHHPSHHETTRYVATKTKYPVLAFLRQPRP